MTTKERIEVEVLNYLSVLSVGNTIKGNSQPDTTVGPLLN